jgi:glycine dehydrogenase subunit 2
MTVFFPLVVPHAMLIEPTETENKETLDRFISVMKKISDDSKKNAEDIKNSPKTTNRKRIDEVLAAKNPILTFDQIEKN